MKKYMFAIVALIALFISTESVVTPPSGDIFKSKRVTVGFNYNHKDGPGSNQYAVWVEDSSGKLVKTLFVTSFTTKGRSRDGEPLVRGYVKRPTCVPTWVEKSNAKEMSDLELDGVTGATPASGHRTYSWDFKDASGNLVAAGKYRICVEATLFNKSSIIYYGDFSVPASKGRIPMTYKYTELDEVHKDMISDIRAWME